MRTSEKTKFKIGVMGSAGRDRKLPEELLGKAREVGREIAHYDCVLITGACMGLPHEAAIGASKEEGLVIGISPAASLKEHIEPPLSYPASVKNMIHTSTPVLAERGEMLFLSEPATRRFFLLVKPAL